MIGLRHVHERDLHGPELQQVEVGLRAAVGHERERVAVGRPRGLQMRVAVVLEARRLFRLQVVEERSLHAFAIPETASLRAVGTPGQGEDLRDAGDLDVLLQASVGS